MLSSASACSHHPSPVPGNLPMLYVIFYACSILQQMSRAVSAHRSYAPGFTFLPFQQLRPQFTAFSSIIQVVNFKNSVNSYSKCPQNFHFFIFLYIQALDFHSHHELFSSQRMFPIHWLHPEYRLFQGQTEDPVPPFSVSHNLSRF